MRILMIEDDIDICEMMSMFFDTENYSATFAHDGAMGLDLFMENPNQWEMIILDLQLPTMSGRQICREIRKVSSGVPIIMVTAHFDTESDEVLGLEMGADDYVTKPISAIALLARIKALYRRSQLQGPYQGEVVNKEFDVITDSIQINTQTREAYYRGQAIENLTPKEFDLLVMFASNPKRVFSREDLLTSLWEDPFYGDERTVDAHIKKLRQKMETVGAKVIQTVWGVGYKYEEASEDQ